MISFSTEDIPNILIISPSFRKNDNKNQVNIDGTLFDLITSQFVGRYNNTDPRLLDRYDISNGKFTGNLDLFPEKFSNLQGRIMRIALFNYMPYAIWEEVVRLEWKNLKMTHFKTKHNYFSHLVRVMPMLLVRMKKKHYLLMEPKH